MTPKRPRSLKLVLAVAPIAILALVLAFSVTVTHAAAPTSQAPASLNHFYQSRAKYPLL